MTVVLLLGLDRSQYVRAGCNAVSIKNNVCWPKKIADGLKIPPNSDPTVDHMSLCPLHPGCGEWLAGYDRPGVGDISGSEKRVEDRDACTELCIRTRKCNAIAYRASDRMCFPKYIPAGRARTPMPSPNSDVDYLQLCPLKLACGTWLEGYDQGGFDIESGKVTILPCSHG